MRREARKRAMAWKGGRSDNLTFAFGARFFASCTFGVRGFVNGLASPTYRPWRYVRKDRVHRLVFSFVGFISGKLLTKRVHWEYNKNRKGYR